MCYRTWETRSKYMLWIFRKRLFNCYSLSCVAENDCQCAGPPRTSEAVKLHTCAMNTRKRKYNDAIGGKCAITVVSTQMQRRMGGRQTSRYNVGYCFLWSDYKICIGVSKYRRRTRRRPAATAVQRGEKEKRKSGWGRERKGFQAEARAYYPTNLLHYLPQNNPPERAFGADRKLKLKLKPSNRFRDPGP